MNTKIFLWFLLLFAVIRPVSGASGLFKTFNTDLAATHSDFMPNSERERILVLLQNEDWAKAEYNRIRKLAQKSDGYYWAAFLYALEKSPEYLPVAHKWLLNFGKAGGDLGKRALDADDAFFKGGQPWLGDVYYRIDLKPYLAYAWVRNSFTRTQRKQIEKGFQASARFRIRAMERWSQTPNLVFKPTCMVGVAGLVTGKTEFLQWGFYRRSWKRPSHGGYFQVLNTVLQDQGPWFEAPLYAIAQKPLLMMNQLSKLLYLKDGQNWFAHKQPQGGSPEGLTDYYLDTTYPMEKTDCGKGRFRIATYGDGSTNAKGDLFLIDPCGSGINMHDELAAAYDVSEYERYAVFLKSVPDYQPNLFDRRALPENPRFPDAPSHVWPDFGIAMLRSDESPAYWTSAEVLAVFQIMSKGYGHGHRDQFSIMLFGAGRLLYPDYNVKQYENPAVGWSRNIIAHNTMTVDEQESRDADPVAVRHKFTPGLKFLATSASQVFKDVDQTRALFLTDSYLLDIFSASGKTVHTYDYLLHSFGQPHPVQPNRYQPTPTLSARYHQIKHQKKIRTHAQWQLDFIINPTSGVRLTMAGVPETQVVYGAGPDNLPALIVRRGQIPATVFTAVHEPFKQPSHCKVRRVSVVARSKAAILVRVETAQFTDYAAVVLDPEQLSQPHILTATDGSQTQVAFRNYAYMRVSSSGSIVKEGEWLGARLPFKQKDSAAKSNPIWKSKIRFVNGFLESGTISPQADPPIPSEPHLFIPVDTIPSIVRMYRNDKQTVVFKVRNSVKGSRKSSLSGRIEPMLPKGFRLIPRFPHFGPIRPGHTAEVKATLIAHRVPAGKNIIPYRIAYSQGKKGKDSPEKYSAPVSLTVMVEPVLTTVYRHPEPSVYRVYAPGYTVEADMFHGLIRYLADDDNTVRLENLPLFTFSDEKEPLLNEHTKHAFTWAQETPASLTAHAYDRCRWQTSFSGDRLMIKMDRDWTQFEKTFFTLPGKWISPQGPPFWKQVMLFNGTVKAAKIGEIQRVAAAELAFPKGNQNLCFQFIPAQEVTLTPAGMSFAIGSLTGDQWTVGFCRPGKLKEWLWR
jgi:hypothetical protein